MNTNWGLVTRLRPGGLIGGIVLAAVLFLSGCSPLAGVPTAVAGATVVRDTPTPPPTRTPLPTRTPFPTVTPIPTRTPRTPLPTYTPPPTRTPLPTRTPFPTYDPSAPRTPQASRTPFLTYTPAPTRTLVPTRTPNPTYTPRPTWTPFPTRTPIPTRTPTATPTATNTPLVNSTVLVADHGGRVDWSAQNVIAYSEYVSDKLGGEIYTMNPDGSAQTCLTCNNSQLSHVSNDQPAWTPNGKYIVFQSVDQALYDALPGTQADRDQMTQGGAGVDNNLWLVTPDGRTLVQLTHIGQGEAVLHPHFSLDGTKLYWAARVMPATSPGGQWNLKEADFFDDSAGPRLANERSYQPEGQAVFYESHDFFPGNQSALFATDANPTEAQQPTVCTCALNIGVLNLSTGLATMLTNTTDVWNEHAQISPDGKRIVWISSQGYPFTPVANWTDTLATDLWMMNPDGSNKHQITFFNTPGKPEYKGGRVILSDGSWNPTSDQYVVQADVAVFPGAQSQVMVLQIGAAQ
jgi:Tol biopolymer transport system component